MGMRANKAAMLALAIGMHGTVGAQGRAAGPRGNPGAYFGPDQYPPEALRKGQEGRTIAGLWIDETGKVVSCTIASSSGSDALDQATCRIALDKVQFSPAIDRHGKPIASQYTLPVRWVIPIEANVPTDMTAKALDTVSELTVSTNASGEVVACHASITPPPPMPVQPCDHYPVGKVAEQLRMTQNGKAVGGTHTMTMHEHITLDP